MWRDNPFYNNYQVYFKRKIVSEEESYEWLQVVT